MIEEIVGLAEHLKPIALLGSGGIGKTSIALTVLHNNRIKKRFGDERRFVRCDQFPPSLIHFLRRLSNVIGAGIENPEGLAPLRPFLSSKEMLIVLDNAESIIDPQVPNAGEIFSAIDELSELSTICLCITSRVSTIPSNCETLEVPTLSINAACDTFYRIYRHGERSGSVNDILKKLDFHPLSITLLATVAQQNKWGIDRLTREWERRRISVLQAGHKKSLAATIELSLASPMFQNLDPDARELLGVVAFFPQGIDEKNFDWLFPAISNKEDIFDKFCILSLTYRSEGFIKMLAPLRDYLSPKDPLSSPFLRMVKDCYFTRLSVPPHPDLPSFGEARWIISEDVNVEHLLNALTSIEVNIWDVCANFLDHLYWHKPRLTVLGPKIEALPDDHPDKPMCLFWLSGSFKAVGNHPERRRLLTAALELFRNRGDLSWIAGALISSSEANRSLGFYEDGIREAREALEIYEQLNNTGGQAQCLTQLAQLLHEDNQLEAAEESISRAITLLRNDDDEQFLVCQSHFILGDIYRSKGDREKAIQHLEISLGIASPHDWHHEMCMGHGTLSAIFCDMRRFDDADSHLERAKFHTTNNAFDSANFLVQQSYVRYHQGRLGDAVSGCSHAADAFEKLGAAREADDCRTIIRDISAEMDKLDRSDRSACNGER